MTRLSLSRRQLVATAKQRRRLRATKARELLHQLQQWPAFGEARSGSAASAFEDKSRLLPPAKPKMTSLALFNLSVEQYPPYQDQSQNPLRAEEASRAYGRRGAAALFSARANHGSVRLPGVGSIHRSFRLALRAVFLSFFTVGRSESAWSAWGSARAATEAEISSIGLASGSFAAAF